MTVTGIKDAYENYRKERSDDEINSQGGFPIDDSWTMSHSHSDDSLAMTHNL